MENEKPADETAAKWWEKVHKPDPVEFQEAMASGDIEKQLLALRKQLVYRIQVAGSRDVAPITKELREVVALLQDLRKGEGVNQLDLSRDAVARQFAELLSRAGGADAPPGTHPDGPPRGNVR